MKTFTHISNHTQPSKLSVEVLNGKRYYTTPSGIKVPSVTSVLGYRKPSGLLEWKKALGEEKSDKITLDAARRGTRVHNLCERYIRNEKINLKSLMPDMKEMFRDLQLSLN